MSAKEFYKKISVNLPELPPELWTTIMRHATWISEGYEDEFSTQQVGLRAGRVNREHLKAWRNSLATKRYLVRVNKAWYKLASPFLYEYVLLWRGKSLVPLLSSLARTQHAVEANEDACSVGWWTHRLDVSLRDLTNVPNDIFATLAEIFMYLPNLHVLTFSITQSEHRHFYSLPFNILESLSCCRQTLKVVHFYLPPVPSTADWTTFLEKHPNLQSINGNFMVLQDSHIKLDNLTTIHITPYVGPHSGASQYGSYIWHVSLPALHAATYDLGKAELPTVCNKDFFARVGEQLTIIQINHFWGDYHDQAMMVNSLQLTFDEILATCHNLEQVNFGFHSWSTLSLYVPTLPPKVKTIGIRITASQISKSMTLTLFGSTFKDLALRNPGLRNIQFLAKSNVQALHSSHRQLYEGVRLLEETGIEIRDHEGSIMHQGSEVRL